MSTIMQKHILTFKQQEFLNHNRKAAIERQCRIQKFKQTVSNEDKELIKVFSWDQFIKETPVELEELVFGEKYMYLPGSGTTGIVRAYPTEDDSGINIEFIATGEQDIIFSKETHKKLYKLPILPKI